MTWHPALLPGLQGGFTGCEEVLMRQPMRLPRNRPPMHDLARARSRTRLRKRTRRRTATLAGDHSRRSSTTGMDRSVDSG